MLTVNINFPRTRGLGTDDRYCITALWALVISGADLLLGPSGRGAKW